MSLDLIFMVDRTCFEGGVEDRGAPGFSKELAAVPEELMLIALDDPEAECGV